MLSGLKTFWRRKISELLPNSRSAIYMMFIYNITELKICVSLRKHPDVTIAENDDAAYTPCLVTHKKLILTAIPLKC